MFESDASSTEDHRLDPDAVRYPWALGGFFLAAMRDAAAGVAPNLETSLATVRDPARSRATPNPMEAASLVAQALIATTMSGLRTWQGLAQAHGTYHAAMLQPVLLASMDGEGGALTARHQADALRRWLRETGEVSLREARRLQAELEALGEAMAQEIAPPDPHAPYRRRWRPKY